MSLSDIFLYVEKINEITAEMRQLSETAIWQLDCRSTEYKEICKLRDKLNLMQIYLDGAWHGLHWRHELRTRLKRELRLLPWVMTGVIFSSLAVYYLAKAGTLC